MSKFGQELSPNDAPALPMWIDGHAYLMMADAFLDVVDVNGKVVRKVPLYGPEAVAIAVTSASRGGEAWAALANRQSCVQELAELLTRYRKHLAGLLVNEAGRTAEAAESELDAALAVLAAAVAGQNVAASGVTAVLTDAGASLAAALAAVLKALAVGQAVIVKPSPKAPSVLFALCELFTRAGFPGGAVNCVHGDEAAVRALAGDADVGRLCFVGAPALAEKIAAIAGECGKPFLSGGSPADFLQIA